MSRRRIRTRDRPRGRSRAKNDVKAGIAALLCCILAVGAGSSLFRVSFDWFSDGSGDSVPGDETVENTPEAPPEEEKDVTDGILSAVAYEKGNGEYSGSSMTFTEHELTNTTYGDASTALFDTGTNREIYRVSGDGVIGGSPDVDKSWIRVLEHAGDNVIDVGKADRDIGVSPYKNYLYLKTQRGRGEYYVFETDFRFLECSGVIIDDVQKTDETVTVSRELASYFKIKLLGADEYYSDFFILYGVTSPDSDKVYLSLDEYEYEGNLICSFEKEAWANIRIEYVPRGTVGIYVNGELVLELATAEDIDDTLFHSVCISAERLAQRMRYQIDNVYASAVGVYEDNDIGDTPWYPVGDW